MSMNVSSKGHIYYSNKMQFCTDNLFSPRTDAIAIGENRTRFQIGADFKYIDRQIFQPIRYLSPEQLQNAIHNNDIRK